MKKLLVITIIGLGAGLATGYITVDDLQKMITSSGGLVMIGGVAALLLLIWTFGRKPGS